jgi:hypothetical protein
MAGEISPEWQNHIDRLSEDGIDTIILADAQATYDLETGRVISIIDHLKEHPKDI